MARIKSDAPLLRQLADANISLDDRMRQALEVAASRPDVAPEDVGLPDSYLTLALYRLNSLLTRSVKLEQVRYNLFHEYKLAPPCPAEQVVPGRRLCDVLNGAVRLAAPSTVIGVGHFLRSIVKLTLDTSAWEYLPGTTIHNTFSAETLLLGLGYTPWTSVSDAPELKGLLAELESQDPIDDYQYLLTCEAGRIVLRPTSILTSCRLDTISNGGADQLAVLTALRKNHGLVTPDELGEFEDLLNNPRALESDIQRFLERHSQFLRLWEHSEAHPHLYLTREDDGPLIPDFVLIDKRLARATVVDLKLPKERVVVHKKNRDRYSAHVQEARAQLLEYRDWFSDSANRQKVKEQLGMDIYSPRLGMLIGRSNDFRSALDRQRLQSREPDVDIFTYDDLHQCAQKRLALITNATRN